MSEIPEELEGILVAGRAFVKLVDSYGWSVFKDGVERMITLRTRNVIRSAGSLDGAFALEAEKGVIEGLRLALTMPESTIAEMRRLQAIKNEGDE